MSTWGQLRFQLQTSAPGVSADLLDEWLNSRYEQVLEATDWTGLEYHATIQTKAAYQSTTDSVTFTVGSTTVTGSGTSWTSAITGLKIYRPGDTVIYTATYASGTGLTLDRPYEGNGTDAPGTVYAASPYVFMQNVYPLPTDVGTVTSIIDPVTGFPLTRFSKDNLDFSAGPRTLVQNPGGYCLYDDGPETSPPVLHQVEFYPPPLYARGMLMEYIHAAQGFDGGNTSGSPLPWVSNSILLAGCRADINTYLGKMAQSMKYEAEFTRELNRMLLLEHTQRRTKTKVRMASRFVRHRMARAARGLNPYWGPGAGGPN